MRAVLCHAWGAVKGLQLGDAPPPIPADGEVLIAVRAAGINSADAIMVARRYQTKPLCCRLLGGGRASLGGDVTGTGATRGVTADRRRRALMLAILLIRLPRLSVQPVSKAEWRIVCQMGGLG